jgi:hypothetical protein
MPSTIARKSPPELQGLHFLHAAHDGTCSASQASESAVLDTPQKTVIANRNN